MATVTTSPIRVFVSGETVTPAKLNELSTPTISVSGIVNADIDAAAAIAGSKLAAGAIADAQVGASAAIAHTKLANITAGRVLLGNASNVPTATEVTGDMTINSTGVTSIGNNKVVTAMINDAAITPAKLAQPLTLATAQSATSGTSIDFTGIPSWVKRITFMLNGVSTSGASSILIQLGDSGGFETSGYTSSAAIQSNVVAPSTQGFIINSTTVAAAGLRSGAIVFTNVSGNIWVASGTIYDSTNGWPNSCAGTKTLSDALTQVRLTTVNGTDTFDAGSVNIMYEG